MTRCRTRPWQSHARANRRAPTDNRTERQRAEAWMRLQLIIEPDIGLAGLVSGAADLLDLLDGQVPTWICTLAAEVAS